MTIQTRLNRPLLGLVLATAICAALALTCAKKPSPEFEEGLSLYRQNKLPEALPMFEQVVAKDKKNVEAYAYLAESYRRLNQTEKAVNAARNALDVDPCNSFAHTVLAAAYNPMYSSWEQVDADSTWRHLMKAVRCDSTDGDAWSWVWTQAILREDRATERRALRRMIETGFLPSPLLSYNRWMLRYLPDHALLLTNGDWDTYPAVALQEVERFRPDVAVVNFPLLNLTWYVEYVRDRYAVPLPFADEELALLRAQSDGSGRILRVADQLLDGWLGMMRSGELTRPIAVSSTVNPQILIPAARDSLRFMGPFSLWQPEAAESHADTTALRVCLSDVNPDDFAGSFFSPIDRSPVRIMLSNRMVDNVTVVSLRYIEALIEAGRIDDAQAQLSWTENFDQKTEWKSPLVEELRRVKETAMRPQQKPD